MMRMSESASESSARSVESGTVSACEAEAAHQGRQRARRASETPGLPHALAVQRPGADC